MYIPFQTNIKVKIFFVFDETKKASFDGPFLSFLSFLSFFLIGLRVGIGYWRQ